MTRWTGGSKVPAGFYWRKSAWEMVTLSGEGGVLPGGRDERYFKVPVLAMLALAPAMGAALVMFLPLMGFMMAGREIVRKARAAAGRPRAAAAPARKAARATCSVPGQCRTSDPPGSCERFMVAETAKRNLPS